MDEICLMLPFSHWSEGFILDEVDLRIMDAEKEGIVTYRGYFPQVPGYLNNQLGRQGTAYQGSP